MLMGFPKILSFTSLPIIVSDLSHEESFGRGNAVEYNSMDPVSIAPVIPEL